MRPRSLLAACLLAALTACTPPPAPTEPAFTGVWVGPLPVSATEQRTFAVVVHERSGRELMGYLLAGTSRRAVLGGLRSGDGMLLVFEMKDQGLAGGHRVERHGLRRHADRNRRFWLDEHSRSLDAAP